MDRREGESCTGERTKEISEEKEEDAIFAGEIFLLI
jgi:hypothetical protein